MIRLFHLSDLHFGTQDHHALRETARIIAAERPDALIITGDITAAGRAGEFAAAAAWLDALPVPRVVVAGNHDAPVANVALRLFDPWRRLRQLRTVMPLDLPGVRIVPLQTAVRAQMRLDWSLGVITRRRLARARAAVAAAPAGTVVLVAAHHPLADPHGLRVPGRTLGGRRALAVLGSAGAAAVLTGHTHQAFDIMAGNGVRLVGAGTLSLRLRGEPPGFNVLTITDGKIGVLARTISG
jgi:3',5'-cyclic AMP phosphodiesterase CpdA